jgi:hypothetical protein
MNYKKHIIIPAVLCFPILFGQFTYLKSTGAHPGSTGAPGDKTCSDADVGCHAGTAVIKDDTTVNKLIFSTLDSTYTPGTKYKIILDVKNLGITRFGFEMVALKKSDDRNIGTFTITEPTRTQIISHDVGKDERFSVTHKKNGTPENPTGSNANQWTFDWTAPATNEGEIVFYYATNCTNNNNSETGDKIYLSSFKIKPKPSSINEYIDDAHFIVSFDKNSQQFILDYTLKNNKNVTIVINDNSGRTIYNRSNLTKTKGLQQDKIAIVNKLSKGIYFINLIIENTKISKKIIVQ